MANDAKIERNAKCPCNSGKKYKNCCIGKAVVGKRSMVIPLIILAIGAIVGAVVFTLSTAYNAGMAFAASVVFATGFYILKDPPEGRGRGGGDQINFGN